MSCTLGEIRSEDEAQVLAYLRLQVAGERFGKAPGELDAEQAALVTQQAQRALAIQARVLTTAETSGITVPAPALEVAFASIRDRYENNAAFQRALSAQGLSAAGLRHAIARQLMFDSALSRLAAEAARVSATEVEIFYLQHRDRFARPEVRGVSQILITVNEQYPDNRRGPVQARLTAIAARLRKAQGRFAEEAKRHSECPTALEGGRMGRVTRGKLFPSLEAVLFALKEGEISDPIESPLGFHLLRCDRIEPAGSVPLEQVRDTIRDALAARKQQRFLRDWLEGR